MKIDVSQLSHYWQSGDFVLYNPSPNVQDVIDTSMIYNVREHSVVIIEDDEVAYELKSQMHLAGVPIVSVPPAGENFLQKAINDLWCLGLGTQEFINAYNEIRGMKLAGASIAEMNKRIHELRQRNS